MYNQVSQSISISVSPAPIPTQSNPAHNIFAFSYTIEILNLREETVQLMSRHWFITSGGRAHDEVVGPGVIGMQPILECGQKFEYTSGAIIVDPFGSMHGTYTMKGDDGREIIVEIPVFNLSYPDAIN